MNPQNMSRLRLAEGDLATVSSRRGSLTLPVHGSAAQLPATVFIAMHWGTNTSAAVSTRGPRRRCAPVQAPELKHAAGGLNLRPAVASGRMAWCDEAQARRLRAALQLLFAQFTVAGCAPFGRERSGVLFRAALPQAASVEMVPTIVRLFDLEGTNHTLHYADALRGQRRSVRVAAVDGDTKLEAFLLAGDTRAEAWIAPLLQQQLPAQAFGRALLAPGASPPGGVPQQVRRSAAAWTSASSASGRCSIASEAPAQRLATLQAQLRCGTQCAARACPN